MEFAASPTVMRFPIVGRLATLPVFAILLLVSLVVAVAALSGVGNLDLPVKFSIAMLIMIAAGSLIFWKPALFPFAIYLFAVPFDNLLQTGAGTATKWLAAASIVIVLLLMTDRRRTVTPPLATFAWLAFLLWSIASLMWSENQAESFNWLTMVVSLFALYALFSLFRIRERELRVLVTAVIAGGVACAAYGLWMFMGGTVASPGMAQSRLNLVFGTTASINADHFAGALVLPIALTLVAALYAVGWRKWLAMGALLLLFAGVFIAATRGAVIAIGVMWLYLMIFSTHGRKQLAAMGILGLLASFALPSVWLRFFDPTQGQAGGRFGIWAVAWESFRHHWLAGVGAGDFRTAYGDAYLKVYQGFSFHAWAEDSHNLIASTSVELGIIGLILLGIALFYQFRTVSAIPRSSSLFDLRLAMEAGLIGLFIVAMTVDLLFFKYLWIGFMLAVLVRNASLAGSVRRTGGQPVEVSGEVDTARLPRIRADVA